MQNTFSNALSAAVSKHIPLSATRRETLAWLALLIMRQGTICLWRLAAPSPHAPPTRRRRRPTGSARSAQKKPSALAVVDAADLAAAIDALHGLMGDVIDRRRAKFIRTVS